MRFQNLLQLFSLMLVVLFLAACGASTTPAESVPSADTPTSPTDTSVPPTDTPIPPTDTPVPPTDTPIPPTDTPTPLPSCELECTGERGISLDDPPLLNIMITCESGEFTDSMSHSMDWEGEWVHHFDGTRIYKDSGHRYNIKAEAKTTVKGNDFVLWYLIKVAGGAFEKEKQCYPPL